MDKFFAGFGIGSLFMTVLFICFPLPVPNQSNSKPIPQQIDKKPEQTIPEKIDLACGSKLLSINYNNSALTILTTPFDRFDKAVTYDFSVNGKKVAITECEPASR